MLVCNIRYMQLNPNVQTGMRHMYNKSQYFLCPSAISFIIGTNGRFGIFRIHAVYLMEFGQLHKAAFLLCSDDNFKVLQGVPQK